MKRIWLTSFLLTFVPSLPGTTLVSVNGWRILRSQNFTALSQLNDADTTALAEKFNRFLYTMRYRMPGDLRRLAPLTVVFFANRDDYWLSAPALKSGDPMEHTAGFSEISAGWLAVEASFQLGSVEDSQRTLFQGGMHWLLSADLRFMPAALRTGLTEVYSTYSIAKGHALIGHPTPGRIRRLQVAVSEPLSSHAYGHFLKVEELLSVKDMDLAVDRHISDLYLDESWAFVHFLLFSQEMKGTHALDQLVEAFGRKLSPQEAMRQAFGPDMNSTELRFATYVRGGNYFEADIPIEPESALTTRPQPATPATVAAVLSRLAVGANHLDLAQTYAEEAIRLDPEVAASYDALAFARSAANKSDEALAACEAAVRLHSQNGVTWFLHAAGRAHDAKNPSPEEARGAINDLEKAVKFQPGIEAAFRRISLLMGTASHVTEDDGKFLVFGRMLYPDDGCIEIGHALWARRINQSNLAAQILDDALRAPDKLEPDELKQAEALKAEWAKYTPN